jgi:hypothetical protein
MRAKVVVIQGPRAMTEFAQAADLFGSSKILAQPVSYEATFSGTVSDTLEAIKRDAEANGNRVAGIFIPSNPEGSWRDPTVRVISDGTRWGLLEDFLAALGFVDNVICVEVPT